MPAGKIWGNLAFRRQNRDYKPLKTPKPVDAIDSETTPNGYARVMADSGEAVEIRRVQDVLDFICQERHHRKFILAWNISFDVNALFKWDRELTIGINRESKYEWGGYQFSYIPRKCLKIRHTGRSFSIYDISQFYNKMSLAKATQVFIGKQPHELKSKRGSLFSEYPLWKIKEYCQDDAWNTAELGRKFVDSLVRGGLNPKHLYSTGYVSQEFCLRSADLPMMYDLPWAVSRMYWNAYRGGWFDIYRRGMLRVTSWDLNSAYPAALWELPDIRHGRWVRGIREDSDLGVVDATVANRHYACQPLALKLGKTSMNIYPVIDEPVRIGLTLGEYKAYRDEMEIEVRKAWSFVPDRDAEYPYRPIIRTLFEQKKAAEKGSVDYMRPKIIMNSMYGKTCEAVRRADGKYRIGQLFNPCYAAEITARTRIAIHNACKPHRDRVVSILTDAVMFDRPITLKPYPQGVPDDGRPEGLGAFEPKHTDTECLMLQTGVYQFKDGEAATRGFSAKNDLWKRCAESTGPDIHVSSRKAFGAKECIIQGRFEDIATFADCEKDIRPNRDLKRLWPKVECAREFLERSFDSRPVPYSLMVLARNPEQTLKLIEKRYGVTAPSG